MCFCLSTPKLGPLHSVQCTLVLHAVYLLSLFFFFLCHFFREIRYTSVLYICMRFKFLFRTLSLSCHDSMFQIFGTMFGRFACSLWDGAIICLMCELKVSFSCWLLNNMSVFVHCIVKTCGWTGSGGFHFQKRGKRVTLCSSDLHLFRVISRAA